MIPQREHTLWVEKYRPLTLDTFIGNKSVIDKMQSCIDANDIPNLLFHGKAGGGKTTLSKIIVNSIECDSLYINASDERNIDLVRNKIKEFAASAGFTPLKVVILDEADFMNPTSTQPALRNLMETFSLHTRFILTCNYPERIIDPLQSRCQSYHLIPPSKKDIAINMAKILETENVVYDVQDIAMIINSCYPDVRKVLNRLQQYSINGKLTIDKESVVESNYAMQILELLKTADKKTCFTEIRKLLNGSGNSSFTDLYSLLYDTIDDYAAGNIAPVIITLAESQAQEPLAIDKEIHAMALFINILNIIK